MSSLMAYLISIYGSQFLQDVFGVEGAGAADIRPYLPSKGIEHVLNALPG